MECPDIRYYLLDYHDGELAPGMVLEFESHLRECKSCAHLVNSFAQVGVVIQAEKQKEPNPFAATRIVQYLDSRHFRRNRMDIRALRPVAITLALFLALALGYVIGTHGLSKPSLTNTPDQEMEMLKSNLYITDFVDEDLGMLTNQ